MATPNRKVLDISHWNTVTDWNAVKNAGIIGIIHKSTEGTGYRDPDYAGAKSAAKQHGLLWGTYHFATAQDPQAQVNNFLDTAGIYDDMLYALDWEDYGDNTMSYSQANRFLELCDAQLGENRTVLYSGNTAKEKISGSDAYFGAHRLWLAQYGSNPTCQQSWSTYWLWQYSDGQVGPSPHGCPGVSGDVDTNSWPSSDAALAEEWSGLEQPDPDPGPGPGPDPEPRPPSILKPTIKIQTIGDVRIIINDETFQPRILGRSRVRRRGEQM